MAPLVALLLAAAPMVVVDEKDVMRDEPPPHGEIGMSTAYRISDAVPQPRTMEFRKRVLHVGAAIGLHPIAHDEVYYVLSGEGVVSSDGVEKPLKSGMTAYLYTGANVGGKACPVISEITAVGKTKACIALHKKKMHGKRKVLPYAHFNRHISKIAILVAIISKKTGGANHGVKHGFTTPD